LSRKKSSDLFSVISKLNRILNNLDFIFYLALLCIYFTSVSFITERHLLKHWDKPPQLNTKNT